MPDPALPRRDAARAEVVSHLQSLTTGSQRVAQAFAARHGLGQIDLEALLAVMEAERAGDPLTSGRLGEALGVTSGAATGVIDRLERVGHVVRRRDEGDRRRVLVHYGERAREDTYDEPYRYRDEFVALEATAEAEGAGLWGRC